MGRIQVAPEVVFFHVWRQRPGEEEREILRGALKERIANLIDTLVMLTADILVWQLIKQAGRKAAAMNALEQISTGIV